MTTYIPESEGIKDEMKEVGVILYVMTGITAIFAFISEDPFIIASCIIFGLLAYYVHAKASFTALIIAGVLILIDTILLIPLMALRPASFFKSPAKKLINRHQTSKHSNKNASTKH